MDNITSRQGVAHFSSRNMRSIIESIVGRDYYIANMDECLSLELSTNNKIKIRSGVLIHHGNVSQVKKGTYDEVSYLNGSQGMKRIDLIVSRLTKDASTEIEKQEWICIQGTPSESDPQAPSYTEGNIQEGDLVDDCPFAELHFDGINVTEVKQLVPVARNTEELEAELDELNRKKILYDTAITADGTYTLTDSVENYSKIYVVISLYDNGRQPFTNIIPEELYGIASKIGFPPFSNSSYFLDTNILLSGNTAKITSFQKGSAVSGARILKIIGSN